jgi:hypothetical protein
MMRLVEWTGRRSLVWLPALILFATVGQLAVATFVPGIERFEDKAFGARLLAYPVMMLFVPAIWWLAVKRRKPDAAVPFVAFALVMLGFLVDTTGNSLDFYDTLVWWDDLNHFVNWVFLNAGIGLLIVGAVRPPWGRVVLVAGIGSLLALGWEIGEWYTFIRHGTEIETAYEDTLGDMTLGTLGGTLAALLVARAKGG